MLRTAAALTVALTLTACSTEPAPSGTSPAGPSAAPAASASNPAGAATTDAMAEFVDQANAAGLKLDLAVERKKEQTYKAMCPGGQLTNIIDIAIGIEEQAGGKVDHDGVYKAADDYCAKVK
jgi:hypothetical protein